MIRVEQLMGTDFTFSVYDEGVEDSCVDPAIEWLRNVEATFSVYIHDSEISKLGDGRLVHAQASRVVRDVLSRCEELEAATGGRFSIRPRRAGQPSLDPSGYVKGWSIDGAARRLRDAGLTRFAIDGGGDILCVGRSPDGDRWRVGVRHPDHPAEVGAVLRVPDGAVATSGTYFRGEHIWGDRASLRAIKSVTVVGPRLGVADALATAIYADQAGSLSWTSSFPDYGILLITADDKMKWTASLDEAVDAELDGHSRVQTPGVS